MSKLLTTLCAVAFVFAVSVTVPRTGEPVFGPNENIEIARGGYGAGGGWGR